MWLGIRHKPECFRAFCPTERVLVPEKVSSGRPYFIPSQQIWVRFVYRLQIGLGRAFCHNGSGAELRSRSTLSEEEEGLEDGVIQNMKQGGAESQRREKRDAAR